MLLLLASSAVGRVLSLVFYHRRLFFFFHFLAYTFTLRCCSVLSRFEGSLLPWMSTPALFFFSFFAVVLECLHRRDRIGFEGYIKYWMEAMLALSS